MIVASTTLPQRMIQPGPQSVANNDSPNVCSSSRCRNVGSVVASRTYSTAKSRHMNLRIAYESQPAPLTPEACLR